MAVGWSAETDGDALTLDNNWDFLESGGGGVDIELTPAANEVIHGFIEYNPVTSPTDTFEFRVLASTDGTNYDTVPVLAFAIDNTDDPSYRSFQIWGYYSLMFQARVTGTTDTTSTATMSWRVATLS